VKLLGKNDNGDLIVTISKSELESLTGMSSYSDQEFKDFIGGKIANINVTRTVTRAKETLELYGLAKTAVSTLKGASTKLLALLADLPKDEA